MGTNVEAGDRQIFSIQADIVKVSDSWIFGHFRFWIAGIPVGNWDDSADLKGCCAHLRTFINKPQSRSEFGLFELGKNEVFDMLWTTMMVVDGKVSKSEPVYKDAVSRFHISHLGMSSFDRVAMILLECQEGSQRCIWNALPDAAIHEALLPAGEMERVSRSFLKKFDQMKAAL